MATPEFQVGSIIRVEMKNFMTFSNVVFNPSPRLNIILGQNGAGKSTIACGVCLALGEDSKLLLRGTKLSEFIKYGEKEADVKVIVKGETSDICVEIRIRKSGQDYYVNGKPQKKEKLEDLRRMLKISLSNLCQFLPQDRVADFVNQNPQKRLREFEKSVGGDDFYSMHTQLINTQQQQKSMEISRIQKEQALTVAEQVNNNLRREKEKFETRNKMMQQKELLALHMKMVEYDVKRKKALETKQSVSEIKKALKVLENDCGILSDQVKLYKNSIEEVKKKELQQRDKGTSSKRELDKCKDQYAQYVMDLKKYKKSLNNIEENRRELRIKLRSKQSELEGIEKEMEEMEGLDQAKQQSLRLGNEISQLKNEYEEVKAPQRDLDMKRKELAGQERRISQMIGKMKSVETNRRNHIKSIDQQLFEIYVWIKEHGKSFVKEVYGPIFNEASFDDPIYGKYFENVVRGTVMRSFVAQTKEDYDLLMKEFKDKRNYSIQLLLVTDGKDDIKRNIPEERMSAFKFIDYFINCIKAPQVVKKALLAASTLRGVVIAKENWAVPNGSDELLDDANERDMNDESIGQLIVLTPSQQIRIYKSLYKNRKTGKKEVSLSYSPLRECRLITNDAVNKDALKKSEMELKQVRTELAKLEESRNEIERKLQTLQTALRAKNDELDQYKNLRKKKQSLLMKKDTIQSDISSIQEDLSKDTESEKTSLMGRMKGVYRKQQDLLVKKEAAIEVLMKVELFSRVFSLIREKQEIILKRFEEEMNTKISEKEQKTSEKRALEREYEGIKQSLKEMRNYIDNDSGLFRCKNNPNPAEFRCVCGSNCENRESMPLLKAVMDENFSTDLDDCNARMRIINDKIREIRVNEKSIQEYEQREAQIATLKKDIETIKKQQEDIRNNAEAKQNDFNKTLKLLVAKLNKQFSAFMKDIQCSGTVELINTDNFNMLGLDIKVSFRKGQEEQSLNGQVQSGGEKSLSTILFLLSLQEMVSFPFRIIDEINQNMDKRNERYVMELLLNKGNKRAIVPQTFIITPKLLSHFPVDDYITFHVIFQGQYLPQRFSWSLLASPFIQMRQEKRKEVNDISSKRKRVIEDLSDWRCFDRTNNKQNISSP